MSFRFLLLLCVLAGFCLFWAYGVDVVRYQPMEIAQLEAPTTPMPQTRLWQVEAQQASTVSEIVFHDIIDSEQSELLAVDEQAKLKIEAWVRQRLGEERFEHNYLNFRNWCYELVTNKGHLTASEVLEHLAGWDDVPGLAGLAVAPFEGQLWQWLRLGDLDVERLWNTQGVQLEFAQAMRHTERATRAAWALVNPDMVETSLHAQFGDHIDEIYRREELTARKHFMRIAALETALGHKLDLAFAVGLNVDPPQPDGD